MKKFDVTFRVNGKKYYKIKNIPLSETIELTAYYLKTQPKISGRDLLTVDFKPLYPDFKIAERK